MSDRHHHLRQQHIRRKFPRGGYEVQTSLGPRLRPVGKLGVPDGTPVVPLRDLLDDPRNLSDEDHELHMRHHNAINPARIEPPAEAWEFARWVGLDWRLEREAA